MGNILVSAADIWSFRGLAFASGWLTLLAYVIFKVFMEKPWSRNAANQRVISETQNKRQKRLNEVKKRVSDQDQALRDEILALSPFDLRNALQNGKYNAEKVLYAYAWKALELNDRFNCLIDFFVESFDWAAEMDREYANAAKPPLYGIPFSVKGSFFMKGYDSCIGLVQYLNQPKTEECTFVTQLRNLGAIPFVYTNVPQTLLSFMCSNPVYGVTGNPYNPDRVPGGSSGGEACLLAAGGAPFGIGSDLAGSLRIPAGHCGVYTIKPTQDRFLVENCVGGVPGRARLGLSYGFFTRSVEEQNFLLGLVLGTKDYKRLVLRGGNAMPFAPDAYAETVAASTLLRIGYFTDDGFMKPTPGCSRVVSETVEKLRAAGHQMVRFQLPSPNEAALLFFRAVLADGGVFFAKLFRNDVVDPNMAKFVFLLNIPMRSLGALVTRPFSPQASIMANSYVSTAEDMRVVNNAIDEYTQTFIAQWRELQLDALVCPAFCVPPVPHEYPSQLGACAFSTGVFNMIDIPAGVVPTGRVTKQDDEDLADEKKWPVGSNFLLSMVRKASANSEGLPLAVQVVTLPFQEEKCLGVMKIVDQLWRP